MTRIHCRLDYNPSANSWVDITDRVYTIDKFTSAGTGEIVSAQIMLDARFDNYVVTSNNNDKTFDQFDLFRLTVWSSFANPVSYSNIPNDHYSRQLILDDISPQKNDEGAFLLLNLFGRERYLQKMFFTGRYFWTSFKDMVKEIIKAYNDNRGTKQPRLVYDLDNMPDYTIGTFEFGDNYTMYECLMDIVSRLELPISAGGGGTPYVLIFEDAGSSPNSDLKLIIKPLGKTVPDDGEFGAEDTPIGVASIHKPISLSEVKNPIRGNVVRVTGADNQGTFPSDLAEFRSAIEEYTNLPQWQDDIDYKKDSIVQYQNAVYRAKRDVVSNAETSSAADWDKIKFNEYRKGEYNDMDDDLQYSPWTHDKHALFKNYAGGRLDGTNTKTLSNKPSGWKNIDCVSFPDSNLVIRDGNVWRDHVDVVIENTDTEIPSHLNYEGETEGYFGFTALIIGDAPNWIDTEGTGTDKNGKSYTNALVQQDRDGDWIVFREPKAFDECAVLNGDSTKGNRMYEYTKELITPDFIETGGHPGRKWRFQTIPDDIDDSELAWRDITITPLGADCFHWPYSIENTHSLLVEGTGADDDPYRIGDSGGRISTDTNALFNLTGQQPNTYFQNSALKIVYKSGLSTNILNAAKILVGEVIEFAENLVGDLAEAATSFFAGLTGNTKDQKHFDDDTEGEGMSNALYEFLESTSEVVGQFENQGWWCTLFEVPFPRSDLNGIDEKVGQLYGGGRGTNTTANPGGTKTPYLDLQNLTVTATGKKGFKYDDSNELTPTDGIAFLFKFAISIPSIHFIAGNLPFRCTMYDIFGNVWVADVAVRFQNETQQIILPWTAFSLYRARTPVSLRASEAIQRAVTPELRITEVFHRQFVKRITFQYQHPYDDRGVFDPFRFEVLLDRIISTAFTEITYTGIIDAFHFITKAVAIAKDSDTSELEYRTANYVLDAPQKNYPGVSNVRQLQKVANAELVRSEFRFDTWTVKVPGQTNLRAGDKVYIQDKHFVDNDETTPKILYVRKVTYSIGDRKVGSAFITTLDLYQFRTVAIP